MAELTRGSGRRSGLAAVVLTDIVDSTRTRVRLGTRYTDLLAVHDRLVRDVLQGRHPAGCVDTGDGFQAMFYSALDALDAACEIQWMVGRHNDTAPQELRFSVRVAIAAGEVVWMSDKPTGLVFHEVSRLEDSVIGGSEIWCTEMVRSLVDGASSYRFVDRTEDEFRGLPGPGIVWRLDWEATPPLPVPAPLPVGLNSGIDLFGRAREQRDLMRFWERRGEDPPSCLVIEGDAGIGKSALAGSVAPAVSEHGWVLHGRCHDDGVRPFGPFAEALVEFARHTAGGHQFIGNHMQYLCRVAPELAEWFPSATEHSPSLNLRAERYELFESIAAWLEELSRHRSTMFVIEDLHLADDATMSALEHVLRRGLNDFAIVATARSETADQSEAYRDRIESIVRQDTVERYALAGLGTDGVSQLLRSHLGAHRATVALAGRFREFTGGNPMYLLGMLDLAEPEAALTGTLSTPGNVHALFESRYAHLDAAAREFVEVAAVMGDVFEVVVVADVAGLKPHQIDGALRQLESAGIVRPVGTSWQFAHAILRQAALTRAKERRSDIHRSLADRIRSEPSAELHAASLSLHYEQAGDYASIGDAAEYAVIAASQATEALAPAEAAKHYARALELYESLPGGLKDDNRCRLMSSLGRALSQAGEPHAATVLIDAARIAQQIGDPALMAKTALATDIGFWTITGSVLDAKVDVLEKALKAIGHGEPVIRVSLMAMLAKELNFLNRSSRREELIRSAEAEARQLHAQQPSSDTCQLLASVLEAKCTTLLDADGLDARRATIAQLDEILPEIRPSRRFPSQSIGCWTALESGDSDIAKGCAREMNEIATATGSPLQRATALHFASAVEMTLGRAERAVELADESHDIHRSIGTIDATVFYVGLHYLPRWFNGSLDTLVPELEECCVIESRIGMIAGLAYARAVSGDHNGSYDELDRIDLDLFTAPVAHQDQVSTLVLVALACHELRDYERLSRTYDLLTRHEGTVVFNGTACFGSVETYLGMMATDLERYGVAERHFAAALRRNQGIPAPCLVADTQLRWATMLEKRREPSDAVRFRSLHDSALRTAHDLRLGDLEHRCQLLVWG